MSSLGETRPDGELVSGGRTWWAHFEFTRIHITPTILPKKIEDLREARHPQAVRRDPNRHLALTRRIDRITIDVAYKDASGPRKG